MQQYFSKLKLDRDLIDRSLIVFAGFIAVAQLSRMTLFYSPAGPSVIITTGGISLAAVILFGYKMLPVVALASLVNGLVNGTQYLVLAATISANVLQAFIGGYILNKFGFSPKLNRLRDALLIFAVGVMTTIIMPAFTSTARYLIGATSPTSWNLVWLAGMTSIIVFTAMIVRWYSNSPLVKVNRQKTESVIIFILLTLVNILIFWTKYNIIGGFNIAILQLALLSWIALRMGMARTTMAFANLFIIAISGLFFGFARPAAEMLSQKIIGIELYTIVFAGIFYMITSVSEEKELAMISTEENYKKLLDANLRIREDDKRKNDFIAVLAHELRNPLAPISNYLEIMDMQGVKETKYKESAEGIAKNVKNLSRLLYDLLDISRVTRGKISLQTEIMDLRNIIKTAAEGTRTRFDTADQTLNLELPASPVFVEADGFRVEQILTNLLHNANKFTPVGGQINIRCENKGHEAIISVTDTGIGISEKAMGVIFDMFSQADTSATRRHSGLGIGLHLSKQLAELHGGTIVAESEGEGKGSKFTLRLPLANSPVEYKAATAASERAQIERRKKILIVDDNESLLSSFVKMFRLMGYEVSAANNGMGALKLVADFKPDAVLLDIGMPGMSGYEVARKLRGELNFKNKLIAVTGYGQNEDKIKAMEAGFDHHLVKPVAASDIEKLI